MPASSTHSSIRSIRWPAPAGARSSFERRLTPGGFTLTELLVVIALIAILVSVLLAALNQVQKKANQTRTLATMQAFINACSAFQQEHGFYPGVVPEHILAGDPQISGTENAILHLMGGYTREEDVDATEFNNASGDIISFSVPGAGSAYRIKVDRARLGEGPIINGKSYAAYLTPGANEFGVAAGQTMWGKSFPDLLDAWGQPILYLRQVRPIGPLVREPMGTGGKEQFLMGPLQPYLASNALGERGENQVTQSLFNTTNPPEPILRIVLENPNLEGQARGAMLVMSAGPDGIFLSEDQQPSGPSGGGNPQTAQFLEEFDDVILFGGD